MKKNINYLNNNNKKYYLNYIYKLNKLKYIKCCINFNRNI